MLSFALVGCGRIAKRHAELLGLDQIKGAQLSAVCDIVEERAKQFGEKYHVPYYKDFDEMMKKELNMTLQTQYKKWKENSGS